MAIEITLFGFGAERPASFGSDNKLRLEIDTPTTPRLVLQAAGIDDDAGLVLMAGDTVIPARHWDRKLVETGARLTLLSALEGG